ncbi:MAG: hypothetical protein K8T90_19275 [Planctomycetes bacterium]|nr:hypothetical protein [Planctomycetota bacterium]
MRDPSKKAATERELRRGIEILERLDLRPLASTAAAVAREHAFDPAEPLVEIPIDSGLGLVPPGAAQCELERTHRVRVTVLERLDAAVRRVPAGFQLEVRESWRTERLQRHVFDVARRVARKSGLDAARYAFDLDGGSAAAGLPAADAPHRTGGAVDVTLLGPGSARWPMGTRFDGLGALTGTASLEQLRTPLGLTGNAALLGRRLLVDIMTAAGFSNYPAEWWHFDFGNAFWRHFGRTSPGPIYRTIDPV